MSESYYRKSMPTAMYIDGITSLHWMSSERATNEVMDWLEKNKAPWMKDPAYASVKQKMRQIVKDELYNVPGQNWSVIQRLIGEQFEKRYLELDRAYRSEGKTNSEKLRELESFKNLYQEIRSNNFIWSMRSTMDLHRIRDEETRTMSREDDNFKEFIGAIKDAAEDDHDPM